MTEIAKCDRDFIAGSGPDFRSFDSLGSQHYINCLWESLRPRAFILNMGIMKKTPTCFEGLVNKKDVETIWHIELDSPRKVKITSKEHVKWKRDINSYLKKCINKKIFFNGVVLWHGPEHLEKEDGIKAIERSFEVAKNWVVVSCPWDRLYGWKHQPKGADNLGHKSVWTQDDFLEMGMRVMSFGKRQIHPGFLVAWRKYED